MKEKCSSCRFFRQETGDVDENEELIDIDAGICCRYAPKPSKIFREDNLWRCRKWAQFPLVNAISWCGEYQSAGK